MRNLNSLIFARSLPKTSLAWSQLFLLVWFMMGVCLLDQYWGTCLPPSITKRRWVELLHSPLIQQGCVAPGVSQLFGYLVLSLNPLRNLMFRAINFSHSTAWYVEQDLPPRVVAGGENGDHGWWKTIHFFWGSHQGVAQPLNSHPWWVLWCWPPNWEWHNSPAMLMGKMNELVPGILICELGKSWASVDLNSPSRKREKGGLPGWRRNHSSLLDGQMCFQLCSQMLQNGGCCWLCFQQTQRHCGHNRVMMLDALQAQLCNIWGQVILLFSWAWFPAMRIAFLPVTQPPITSFPSVLRKSSNSPSETRPAAANRFSGSFWSFILACC